MVDRVDLLLTSPLADGMDSIFAGEAEMVLHLWRPSEPLPRVGTIAFAYVDWAGPDMAGLEVCRRLRCDPLTARAHITMVIDPGDADARARALRVGADDYVAAPLTRAALTERIAAARQAQGLDAGPGLAALGGLVVDRAAFQARWHGKPITLMPNELRLLGWFVEHPGRVFTRAQLIEALGKQEPPLDERTVDVWIGRLRRALRSAGVDRTPRTVRSLGYVLDIS